MLRLGAGLSRYGADRRSDPARRPRVPQGGIAIYIISRYIAGMTASELYAVNVFHTEISEQDIELLSQVQTIRLRPATFRRLMLNAKVQGMNRTESLRYAIELGSLTPEL